MLGVLVVQQRLQRRFDASEEAFLVTLSAQLAGIIAHAEATGGMARLGRRRGQRRDARFPGVPGAPGVVHGTAVVLFPSATLEAVPDQKSDDVAQELELFRRALGAARTDIEGLGAQLQDRLNAQERALFDAYLAMNIIAGSYGKTLINLFDIDVLTQKDIKIEDILVVQQVPVNILFTLTTPILQLLSLPSLKANNGN